MKEIIISKNESGQRLNKFLLKYLDNATSSFIYKMLRKKNIVLNDCKAKGDEILTQGDKVKLYLADETIDKFRKKNQEKLLPTSKKTIDDKLKVLYSSDDYIAVHKPAGILSQKASKEDYSINESIVDYCTKNNIVQDEDLQTFKPSVCNRLDRNTSGIILAGVSLKGSQYLTKAFKDRTVDKYYFTIVSGILKNNISSKGYIIKDKENNISKVLKPSEYNKLSEEERSKYSYIETNFMPLSHGDNLTLLKIKLITGKSHQIRAHLQFLGYPVIGDSKYGNISVNRYMRDKYKLKHHLLHSGVVEFSDGTVIKDDFTDIFKKICLGENIDMPTI